MKEPYIIDRETGYNYNIFKSDHWKKRAEFYAKKRMFLYVWQSLFIHYKNKIKRLFR